MKQEYKIISSKQDLSEKDKSKKITYLIDADEKTIRSVIASIKDKQIKNKQIAVYGRDNIFNRRVLETCKIDILISPERDLKHERKDSLKQRDSGLNHVIAKIATKNKASVAIDFADIKNTPDQKQLAKRLARIMQNIKICRKAKTKIIILDMSGKATKQEIQALGFSLGMSSQQVSESI